MNIIETIFMTIVVLFIGLIAVGIFLQTFMDLWNEVGKDFWNDLMSKFRNTKIGMWYFNKKNGIEIISDKEYDNLLKSGKIKLMIVEV